METSEPRTDTGTYQMKEQHGNAMPELWQSLSRMCRGFI